jgi:hypothetical protein
MYEETEQIMESEKVAMQEFLFEWLLQHAMNWSNPSRLEWKIALEARKAGYLEWGLDNEFRLTDKGYEFIMEFDD